VNAFSPLVLSVFIPCVRVLTAFYRVNVVELYLEKNCFAQSRGGRKVGVNGKMMARFDTKKADADYKSAPAF
jgi:hypothetical protein